MSVNKKDLVFCTVKTKFDLIKSRLHVPKSNTNLRNRSEYTIS